MLSCQAAEAFIVTEADGEISPGDRDRLDVHAAGCPRCCALREANLAVKAALSRRVDAEAPVGFSARVSARIATVEAAGWLAGIDWRRGTEWMLPVAAALALLVALAGDTSTSSSVARQEETAIVDAGATADEPALTGEEALGQDVTTEELLAAMLGSGTGEKD